MGNSESANCASAIVSDGALTLGCVGLGAVIFPLGVACSSGASTKAGIDASQQCAASFGVHGHRNKRSPGHAHHVLGAFDTNQDGFLSNEDIPRFVTDPHIKMMIIGLMTMLPVLDTDNDGRLSQSELLEFRHSTQTDRGQLYYMFKFLDINKDERLTPNELVQVTGPSSIIEHKTEAFDGFKLTMSALGCDKKGYVDFKDLWHFYKTRPKIAGQDTLWHFQTLKRKRPDIFGDAVFG